MQAHASGHFDPIGIAGLVGRNVFACFLTALVGLISVYPAFLVWLLLLIPIFYVGQVIFLLLPEPLGAAAAILVFAVSSAAMFGACCILLVKLARGVSRSMNAWPPLAAACGIAGFSLGFLFILGMIWSWLDCKPPDCVVV